MKYIAPFPASVLHSSVIWSYMQSELLQFRRKREKERENEDKTGDWNSNSHKIPVQHILAVSKLSLL